jgi:tol-pal system protein YbgF
MTTRSAFSIFTAVFVLSASAALLESGAAIGQSAEFRSLVDRLNRIERDLQGVQRRVYRGGGGRGGAAPSSVAPPTDPRHAARLELRLNQLETELRNMTGQIEEVNFGLRQLQARLDKLVTDVDFRLQAIEQGRAGGPAGGAAQAGAANQAAPAAPPAPGQQATLSKVNLPEGTPAEQYDFALSLLKQFRYGEAQQAFGTFLERNPTHKLAENAQYWLGETHYVQREFSKAAGIFLEGYRKYPKGIKAPDNLLKLGKSLAGLGKKNEACASFDRLNKEFPRAPAPVKQRAKQERDKIGCP